jgi:hypothetical protein
VEKALGSDPFGTTGEPGVVHGVVLNALLGQQDNVDNA